MDKLSANQRLDWTTSRTPGERGIWGVETGGQTTTWNIDLIVVNWEAIRPDHNYGLFSLLGGRQQGL